MRKITFFNIIILLLFLIVGQSYSLIDYNYVVSIGLQESSEEVTKVGIAWIKAFAIGDTLAYIPLLLLGIIGMIKKRKWGYYSMFASLAISVYWPIVNLSAIYLAKNDINLKDAIDIRELKNIKLANQLLKVKRQKKQEKDQQFAMTQKQMDAQTKMQVQQMQSEQEMRKIQMEAQVQMQAKQAEVAFDIERLKNEAMLKRELMQVEFDFNMQLKGREEQAIDKREKEREKAKNKRISQANTEQSQLIQQRKNNLPPISFEANEDTLDGFDLAEFEPR